MKEFKVGEAPWEKKQAAPVEFEAGKAPWEQETPAPEPEKGFLDSAKEMGGKALDYGLRGLDYAGGLGRMAGAGYVDLYNVLTGNPTVSREGDLTRALKGQAPAGSEYLERSGMEPGLKREAIGFGLDVAADPLTYLSGGASAVAKGGKLAKAGNVLKNVAVKPGKNLSEKIGNKMIRSGVSKIDETLEIAGKKPLSDIMIEEGIQGTNKTIKKKVDELGKRYATERADMYKMVDDAGGKVQTGDILDAIQDYADGIRQKTGNQLGYDTASKLEDLALKAIPEGGEMSLQKASSIKTQLRKSLPDSFYNGLGQVKDEYKQGLDKLSSIFQKNIEDVAEKTVPGMGTAIAEKNKRWGTLLDADSPLSREARKAAGKNALTTVDAMYGVGVGMAKGQEAGLAAAALKKAADVSKTTSFRTIGGRALKEAGKPVDPILRRLMINAGGQNEPNMSLPQGNPWEGVTDMRER